MSLVSDALKKAQREAAAREARAHGLSEPPASGRHPFRPSPRRGRTAWIAALAALGALGAGTAWFFARAPESGAAIAARPSATAVPVLTPVPSREVVTATPEPPPATPTPAPAGVPPASSPTSSPSPTAAPAVEAEPQATAPPSAPAPRASAVHVREATLADGRTIRLGGIAYSEVAPLAYVNGRLLGVGERVEGCTVERIERGRVRLGCAEGDVTIVLE